MKKVVIAGLGLIGGSMAKAFKAHSDWQVYGWNRTAAVAERALAEAAIDAVATDADIVDCDLLIPVLYPRSTIDFLRRVIPTMRPGAMIVDLVGVKTAVIDAVEPLALERGIRYTGGHPMAGLAKGGFARSFADLYKGANMILVPTAATAEGDLDYLGALFRQVGFGRIKICDKQTHDRMIAHTSQLAHVVSNAYVKSPVSANYVGFTGGSYKDMTRIACVNEMIWKDLFLYNREALLTEIDTLLDNIGQVRQALAAEDEPALEELLRQGRLCKEEIDHLNSQEPSD